MLQRVLCRAVTKSSVVTTTSQLSSTHYYHCQHHHGCQHIINIVCKQVQTHLMSSTYLSWILSNLSANVQTWFGMPKVIKWFVPMTITCWQNDSEVFAICVMTIDCVWLLLKYETFSFNCWWRWLFWKFQRFIWHEATLQGPQETDATGLRLKLILAVFP